MIRKDYRRKFKNIQLHTDLRFSYNITQHLFIRRVYFKLIRLT